MARPRTYQTEAVVIKKTKLGEADRILTLYTLERGKIQAVAKGIRRPRAKLAGHLELLTYTQVSLARGRNLDTIIGSQTIDSFLPVRNDLWLTSCGLYAAELVNQFTAEQSEDRSLFRLLVATLGCLGQGGNELVLRHFEVGLLKNAGYRPEIRHCVLCRQDIESARSAFSAGAGGVLCPDCARRQYPAYPISADALRVLRLLDESDLASAGQLGISPELAEELEMLMRNYIRYILEREVRSVAWLDALRQGGRAAVAFTPRPIR